jgi:hypothetical protein
MRIRKFNEKWDPETNLLDVDTLLRILEEIEDEIDGVRIFLFCATGYGMDINDYIQYERDRFKWCIPLLSATERFWYFDIQYNIKDFSQYSKIIQVVDKQIIRLENLGWKVSSYEPRKGIDSPNFFSTLSLKFKPV